MKKHTVIALVLGLGLVWATPARAADCTRVAPSAIEGAVSMKRFGELVATQIDACAADGRREDGAAFWEKHGLDATAERQRDYARVRTLFELTRDGGPWRLRWAVTNEEPTAKKIWQAWASRPPTSLSSSATATAECDEISALFAGLARRLDVRNVGLFWPTANHTIAAWEPARGVRVLVPTTQIYAACDDTFDHAPFSPKVQRTVFELPTSDVPDKTVVPGATASFLLDQVSSYAGASLELLGAVRLHRAIAFRSSVAPSCRESVRATVAVMKRRALSAADRKALLRYADELGVAPASDDARVQAILDRMAVE